MGNKNREIKEAKVAEIKEKIEKSEGVIFAHYQGLNVQEDTELRRKLREAGVEYKVYKNTLTTLAVKELGIEEIIPYLEGPISIAFGYEDPIVPAKVLNNFAKEHKSLELKAGIISGEVYDQDKVNYLSTLPSRDELIAKLLGSFKAPVSNFVYLLNAVKEKKEAEEAEA